MPPEFLTEDCLVTAVSSIAKVYLASISLLFIFQLAFLGAV